MKPKQVTKSIICDYCISLLRLNFFTKPQDIGGGESSSAETKLAEWRSVRGVISLPQD